MCLQVCLQVHGPIPQLSEHKTPAHWVDLDLGFSRLGWAESPAVLFKRVWEGPLPLDRCSFPHTGIKTT